jgi:hypothetical protein
MGSFTNEYIGSIACSECGAEKPSSGDTEREAVNEWNRRALASPPAPTSIDKWREWFQRNCPGWENVECIECELGRDCDKHPPAPTLDSPAFEPQQLKDFAAREYERINRVPAPKAPDADDLAVMDLSVAAFRRGLEAAREACRELARKHEGSGLGYDAEGAPDTATREWLRGKGESLRELDGILALLMAQGSAKP